MEIFCETKNPKLKNSILNEMSSNDKYFKALHEVVHNISIKNLKLKPSIKRKLKQHLKILDKILCKPKCKRKRAAIVKQSGGFLPILLSLVAPVVAELVSNAFSKKD